MFLTHKNIAFERNHLVGFTGLPNLFEIFDFSI